MMMLRAAFALLCVPVVTSAACSCANGEQEGLRGVFWKSSLTDNVNRLPESGSSLWTSTDGRIERVVANLDQAQTADAWPDVPSAYTRDYVDVHTGLLRVSVSGDYELHVTSNDGSRVLLGGQEVVNNDGAHGMIERSGSRYLEAGVVEIEVQHFQGTGTAGLILKWTPPGGVKEVVPVGSFSHCNCGSPPPPVSVPPATPAAGLACPAGTEQVGPANADVSGCGLDGCGARYWDSTIEQCDAHCAQNANCKSFTWAPIGGDKNVLGETVCTIYNRDTHTATWGPNQIMCKRSAVTTPTPPTPPPTPAPTPPTLQPVSVPPATPAAGLACPAGNEQVGPANADVSGCGLDGCGARYWDSTIEQCDAHCAQNANCKSFTWAPIGGDKNVLGETVCTIYNRDTHTAIWGPNQIMCKRSVVLTPTPPTPPPVPTPPPTPAPTGIVAPFFNGKDFAGFGFAVQKTNSNRDRFPSGPSLKRG